MNPARLFLTAVLLTTAPALAQEMPEEQALPAELGFPIANGQYVAVSNLAYEADKIYCLSRADGKVLWEVTEKGGNLSPGFFADGKLYFYSNSGIQAADLKTGKTEAVIKAPFANGFMDKAKLPVAYINGSRNDIDVLALFDLKTKQPLGEVPDVLEVLEKKDNLLLCETAKPMTLPLGIDVFVNANFIAVNALDGKVLWTQPGPSTSEIMGGVAVGNQFALSPMDGTVHFVDQKTGKSAKVIKLSEGKRLPVPIKLAAGQGKVYAWARLPQENAPDKLAVYEIDPATYTHKELFIPAHGAASVLVKDGVILGDDWDKVTAYDLATGKKLWNLGMTYWDDVTDGQLIYSATEPNSASGTLNAIDLKTGKITKIADLPLPKPKE